LVPARGVPPLARLWQVRWPAEFGGVDQQPLAPEAGGAIPALASEFRPGPVALVPETPGEAAGVPVERQLVVRDAAGRALPDRQILLQAHRPDPSPPGPELADVPAVAVVAGWVWRVDVQLASDAPAPYRGVAAVGVRGDAPPRPSALSPLGIAAPAPPRSSTLVLGGHAHLRPCPGPR
jgi:hypothetical protein